MTRKRVSFPLFFSLRGRLLFLICLATLPAILFTFFVAENERAATLARTERDALHLARLTSREHAHQIQAARDKTDVYAKAARRMRRGRQLVISGFVVAVVGIVAYCIACFSTGVNQEFGSALLENPEWLVAPTLGVIGLGTLLWLVGSFLYLIGGMDSDLEESDFHF